MEPNVKRLILPGPPVLNKCPHSDEPLTAHVNGLLEKQLLPPVVLRLWF